MNHNVGQCARVLLQTKDGRVPVVSQQEYEKQMKNVVKEAHQE